jgi:ribonuclease P protein component
MLARKHRLKKNEEINVVFQKGGVWHTPFFSAKFLVQPNEELPLRAAFSFGKKFLRKAVERNRLKRRISSELQKYETFLAQPVDVVFYLPSQKPTPNQGELQKAVESFVKRVYTGYKTSHK